MVTFWWQVVDIVLFCLDQDRLKKKNLLELFPPFSRSVSQSIRYAAAIASLWFVAFQTSVTHSSPSD